MMVHFKSLTQVYQKFTKNSQNEMILKIDLILRPLQWHRINGAYPWIGGLQSGALDWCI